ncbi:MAG TPA: glycoside hydrolase family 3 C-terminal domain-containing protein [Candidatus Acidoferrum sp.]|nr:glycoside hydrolase family 3 C-terminal domain-containing protein [Candidatus Acidoferrum sp.]
MRSAIVGLCCVTLLPLLPPGSARAQAPGAPPADFEARARQIVAQMTLEEKIAQLHGIRDSANYRVVPGLARLGIPALTVANGPAGVGPAGPGHEGKATALPAPIALAATWDLEAARLHGDVAGAEAVLLGNLLLESPDINIARTPHNGRTFESFGEDPFLSGRLAAAYVRGIQSHPVIANVKHYAGNNQEQGRMNVNDIIDERTLRELYLPAFEAAIVEGGCASLMGAYNKVNGAYCCENDVLLNQILKGDWKFGGFVTSDFGAVHSTVPSAKAGLDLEMPTGRYFDEALKTAVRAGEVPEAMLDEKLARRFRTMMSRGVWDQPPGRGPIPPENAALAMKLGAEGIVLLKNAGGQLPLQAGAIHSLAVIGPFAAHAMTGGGGSSHVNPILTVDPVPGLHQFAGNDVKISEEDGTKVAAAVAAAKAADAAILMLGDRQTEGRDHLIALSEDQNALAAAVLAANPHTIVVLKSGGPVLLPWADQAPAILEAWYPGEEDGAAVAAVLFGAVNPSGKLPITFPKEEADLPLQSAEQYPGVQNVAQYSEGLLVGYRWYDARKIEPLFAFGHGLSYTTFTYANLKVAAPTPAGSVTVEFDLANSGRRAGAEVAQLYLGLPSLPNVAQPPRQLKGFRRVELAGGQSAHVALTLEARALSYWDAASHGWKVAPGSYSVWVGSASRDLRLNQTFDIK